MASIIDKIANKLNLYSQDKEATELRYWRTKKKEEKNLGNEHYKYFYTDHFELADDFFASKKILDIGCGPRGSLEWADLAEEKIGLDPLANDYLKLGADQHKMQYVASYSESIPFGDNYFDVVCSFNSIDHVEDLSQTCSEIKRVLKPGGMFLLLVDIHEHPTVCEPQTIDWNFMKDYFPRFLIQSEEHYEKPVRSIFGSIRQRVPFDHQKPEGRYGVLSVKAIKEEAH